MEDAVPAFHTEPAGTCSVDTVTQPMAGPNGAAGAAPGKKGAPPLAAASSAKKLPLLLFVFLSALVYNQIQPPPAKIPGTPGGPPVTMPRIKLRDGRHLAYLESGFPKEKAKYKIIYVHGFDCCRYDVLNVSQFGMIVGG